MSVPAGKDAQLLAEGGRLFRAGAFDRCVELCAAGSADLDPARLGASVDLMLLEFDARRARGLDGWEEWRLLADIAEGAVATAGRWRKQFGAAPPWRVVARGAQARNRLGLARCALITSNPRNRPDGRPRDVALAVAELDGVLDIHAAALRDLISIDPHGPGVDLGELHASIVTTHTGHASVLVAQAERLRGDAAEARMAEALRQFQLSRYAADDLPAEARVATLNDEADVALRLDRTAAEEIVRRARVLLANIDDPGLRDFWERRLGAGTRTAGPVGTVDIYYLPWSPALSEPHTTSDPRERFRRGVAALAKLFSARTRIESPLLRVGWPGVHLDVLDATLDAAVRLGHHAAVCELIETCRAQGYSDRSGAEPITGDPADPALDQALDQALAAMGRVPLTAPPGVTVNGASILGLDTPDRVDVDDVRRRALGDAAWWWSMLPVRSSLYWSLLTKDGLVSGRLPLPDGPGDRFTAIVPAALRDELARRGGDDPLTLAVAGCPPMAGVVWATLPISPAVDAPPLVAAADICLVPPIPLLDTCLRRETLAGEWPVTVVVAAGDDLGEIGDLLADSARVLLGRAGDPVGPSAVAAFGAVAGEHPDGTFALAGSGLHAHDDDVALTAEDILRRRRQDDDFRLPARLLLAAYDPAGEGRTSLAPAALYAGAEVVVTTTARPAGDAGTFATHRAVVEILVREGDPVRALNAMQRQAVEDRGPDDARLGYAALIGSTPVGAKPPRAPVTGGEPGSGATPTATTPSAPTVNATARQKNR